eukprot:TRINITY_DN23977_c0_g2_i1.p1 TRINITY_DN23977_c0_g2~~TRINITY_DN23977_c0_g2_i1.p1  ORF type:complete len:552 (+),score=155.71 TRINITY_DN23977_c0_g2_i1:200-1855(+)
MRQDLGALHASYDLDVPGAIGTSLRRGLLGGSSSHVTPSEEIICRYGVPTSRVVNVTQILGRPLPHKAASRRLDALGDLDAGVSLSSSLSLPSFAAGSSRATSPRTAASGGGGRRKMLSVADLRRIALPPPEPRRRRCGGREAAAASKRPASSAGVPSVSNSVAGDAEVPVRAQTSPATVEQLVEEEAPLDGPEAAPAASPQQEAIFKACRAMAAANADEGSDLGDITEDDSSTASSPSSQARAASNGAAEAPSQPTASVRPRPAPLSGGSSARPKRPARSNARARRASVAGVGKKLLQQSVSSFGGGIPDGMQSPQGKVPWEESDSGSEESSEERERVRTRSSDAMVGVRGNAGDSPGGAHGNQTAARRRDNPFIAFEDRELRLKQERRWLQDEPDHFMRRYRELALGSCMSKLERDARDENELFEEALFHTPYSVKVQALVSLRHELKRLKTESFSGTATEDVRRMMTSGREELRKLMKSSKSPLQQTTQDPGTKGKRNERNMQAACVRLLRTMQEELRESNFLERNTQKVIPVKEENTLFKGMVVNFK